MFKHRYLNKFNTRNIIVLSVVQGERKADAGQYQEGAGAHQSGGARRRRQRHRRAAHVHGRHGACVLRGREAGAAAADRRRDREGRVD